MIDPSTGAVLPDRPKSAGVPRGRLLTVACLGLVLILDVLAYRSIRRRSARAVGADRAVAEAFLDDLVSGNLPAKGGGEAIGYAAAYDRLSARRRETLEFGDFVLAFNDDVGDWGVVDSFRRLDEEGGDVEGRLLHFRLGYSGVAGRRRFRRLELRLCREGEGHAVDDFRLGDEMR